MGYNYNYYYCHSPIPYEPKAGKSQLEVGSLHCRASWVVEHAHRATRLSFLGLQVEGYLKLPNPTFLKVLIINPNMEFIGALQKSRFW